MSNQVVQNQPMAQQGQPFQQGQQEQPPPYQAQGQPVYQGQPMYQPPQGQPMYQGQPPMFQGQVAPAYQGQPVYQGQPMQQGQGQSVVQNQTVVIQSQPGGNTTGQWSYGLCGCMSNCSICIVTYLFPCITFGNTADNLGKSCCLYCIIFFIPILNFVCEVMQRGEIRHRRGIDGSCVGDCLTVWCCTLCALCQEAQEVQVMKQQERAAANTGVTVVAAQNVQRY